MPSTGKTKGRANRATIQQKQESTNSTCTQEIEDQRYKADNDGNRDQTYNAHNDGLIEIWKKGNIQSSYRNGKLD